MGYGEKLIFNQKNWKIHEKCSGYISNIKQEFYKRKQATVKESSWKNNKGMK